MAGQYPDIPYNGPPKSYNSTSYAKRYVAIHNTSNDASAEAEASYATRRTDGTSSHYYNDNDSIVQSLHTDLGANHAGSSTGNRHAISYEITGVNGWTRQQWLDRVQWSLLSRQISRDCRRHGIVPQLLTVAQMRDGKTTGLVTHDLMRQAWGGTDHTDPGRNFPMDHLLALVRAELGGTAMAWEPTPHEAINAIVNGSTDKGYVTGKEQAGTEAASIGIVATVNLRTMDAKLNDVKAQLAILLARPTATVDAKALAAELAALGVSGATPAQVETAMRNVLLHGVAPE